MALSLVSRAVPQLPRFGFLSAAIALPSISITVPPLLSDLWDSVLRAVPKKKTSHMKKRHRQMAGKALKDVQSLNKCPGCGQVKRAHLLCPNCVKGTCVHGNVCRRGHVMPLGSGDMEWTLFLPLLDLEGGQAKDVRKLGL
ncbi:54S ribosomal protein L32 [Penicillium longicatenatum]|nr:54S ribosomal protein L32 [Penicillium longicatenatum]